MNSLEKDVREKTAVVRKYFRLIREILSLLETNNLEPYDFQVELFELNNKFEAARNELKDSLEKYFEYENNNPTIPKNFLFKKLYKNVCE